ncbi:MAG: helix-hairpin-helix domain-containing protein [Chloroflexota bacterium]|nr:helix-hairpin-helix domain-containing protein [Chloroflexota bacterium]MDE2969570.1 helix-hairpin-helix domain-containing protein [Chloroflexota bacterium]
MVQGQQEPPQGARGIDRWMPLVLVLLFLLALVGGVALLVQRGNGGGVEVVLPQPTATPVLKAYAAGAVSRPGVYTFSDGDRLDDLLRMAGGPLDDADASGLNLALRLRDEGHYYVPTVGETPLVTSHGGASVAGDVIDLNAATAHDFETLPGIGAVKAQAIVEHRETVGRFTAVEELLQVAGIGPATLNAIHDHVIVR